MATFVPFECFVADCANGVHNLGSNTLQVALLPAAPLATNTILTNLTQISSYANLSTQVVSVVSSAQTSGAYKLVCTDLVLTCTGAVDTFRYVVLFNQTAANDPLIAYWDRGSNVTLAVSGDNFTIDFDPAGVVTLAMP